MTDDSQPTPVAVIGQGVIGLSCALRLAQHGYEVTIYSREPAEASVSAVAAAIWFPFEAHPLDRVIDWSAFSLERFLELAANPATGVALRTGYLLHRRPDPDLRSIAFVPGHREALPDELPEGVLSATVCEVPVIEMDRYLPWLRERALAAGVRLVSQTIDDIAELDERYATVVVCAGLQSGGLLDDDSMYPIRGQVVRLHNEQRFATWYLDYDNPAGLTYVVPRSRDVVIGGTHQYGDWDESVDPATEREMIARAAAIAPELGRLPIASRNVGLRPGRSAVRLERLEYEGRAVIACYGHGGAGVTMSWGCAEEVVSLAAAND